jgi:cyclopropane fatty-acyl-phospholipid synthase-like methyltransferase
LSKKFDAIVLPDVIEHIPFVLYEQFFSNLYQMLSDDGFVFIHIPHPNYLEWMVKNENKDLQVIDQPVYTDKLLTIVYPKGFYLDQLRSYSVYSVEDDYQLLILKKKLGRRNYQMQGPYFQPPLSVRISKKIKYIFRGFK